MALSRKRTDPCGGYPERRPEASGPERQKAYRERYRDIFKNMDGVEFRLFIGMEHQGHVHYAMPVRIMDYDSASYALQRDEIRRQHEEAADLTDADERLSGFARTDRLVPVITLVLYCGSRPWDAASSLCELLDLEGVPPELRRYVTDYRIHVLDICHTPDRRLRNFRRISAPCFYF